MSDEHFDAPGEVPLVLLPVRVETRYTLDGTALRVRIWPDDLHVDPLGPGLRDGERVPAEEYWTAVWADESATAAEWPVLVQAVGPSRAAWVAEQTRPLNWDDRDPALPDQPPPAFLDVAAAGSAGPQVRTLPTQFVVEVRQGDEQRRVPGNVIPDVVSTAVLGEGLPSPAELEAGAVPVTDAARWMTDYAEAERVGLAVTVELALPGRPVDQLTVAGVRQQLDPKDSAQLLHDLLRAHRFSSGAAFVEVGTPTNNVEAVRSAVDRNDAPTPRTLAPQPPPPGTDGARAATALGVDPAAFADWANADAHHQRRAAAFVTALFDTTIGTFLGDRLPSEQQGGLFPRGAPAALRRHAIAHLRGRGPLPPLRIGKQPYGILPVTLNTELDSLRTFWEAGAGDVPTVMAGDLDRHLPDLLGTLAVSTGVRVRTVAEAPRTFGRGIGLPFIDEDTLLQARATAMLTNPTGFNPTHVKTDGLLGRADRQLAIPMVDATDVEFVQRLAVHMDGDATPLPAAASLLQVLLAHAVRHLEVESTSIATGVELDEFGGHFLEFAAVHGVDVDLVREALREVQQDQLSDVTLQAADHLESQVGAADLDGIRDRPIVPPVEATSALAVAIGQTGARPLLDDGREVLQVLGARFAAARVRAEVREALDVIAEIADDEARRIHLMEYLDVCSHRLDAWITSVASAQLAERAARQAGPGVVVGAYGYVEGIRPSQPLEAAAPRGLDGVDLLRDRHPGGYVHAPSPAHAATAAVLRAGRLHHFRGDANTAALDIELSSSRARLARHLIEGVRRGQSLGALLGYRLERRLHEDPRELDRYIYVLRGVAPLLDAKLTEQAVAHEAIAANNVVDGVRLIEKPWEPTVRQALVDGPKDKSFLPGGVWPPPGAGDLDAVRAHIEALAEDLDAVADVLLAESVHQLVGGNTARAAAALDALGAGEAVPPEPDVIATPRSGTAIHHRVVVTVPLTAPAWGGASPRALADEALESWTADQLGSPASWPVGGSTLADTELGALDVAYDSDGESFEQSTLAWRLRRHLGADADLSGGDRLWHLAAAVRAVLAGGRTVTEGVDPVALRQRAGDVWTRMTEATTTAIDDLGADAAAVIELLAGHGIPIGTIPATDAPPDVLAALAAAMVGEAQRRLAAAAAHLAAADEAIATPPAGSPDAARTIVVERSLEAIRTLLGDGFCIVAPTTAVLRVATGDAATPFVGAPALAPDVVGDGRDLRPWIARMGTVRGALARYSQALVVREALGAERRHLRAAQHGWVAAGQPVPWVGGPFPADVPPPTGPVHHVVVESADGSLPDGATEVGAFTVDSWVEVVPRRIARFDVDDVGDPVLRDIVTPATTGLAVGANGPNARAPQVVLIAAQPFAARWTEGVVFGTVREAIGLGKLRAVTLERLPWAGRVLPALYFRDWSLQGRPVIDYARLARDLETTSSVMKYVKG